MKRGMTAAVLALCLLVLTGACALGEEETVTITREEYDRYRQFDELLEIMDLVDEYYYTDVDPQCLLDAAAAGMLEGIGDSYTYYYSKEEFDALWEEDDGHLAGIGVSLSSHPDTGTVVVTRVTEYGPAERAGLRRGDVLWLVDGRPVDASRGLGRVIDALRGEPGSEVVLTVSRDDTPVTLTVVRGWTNSVYVSSRMLDGGIGYIRVTEFSGDADDQFARALSDLTEQGMKGLILDLRDNGGGWIETSRSIADRFLRAGCYCYLTDRNGNRESYNTRTDGLEVSLPIAVLVNEETASGAELTALCLKERANAVIVGEKTFGQGVVQSVITLERGTGIQLTVSYLYSPGGTVVDGTGITPDVEAAPTPGAAYGSPEDSQLRTALQTVRILTQIPALSR